MRRLVNKGAEIAPIELLTDRGAYFNGVDNIMELKSPAATNMYKGSIAINAICQEENYLSYNLIGNGWNYRVAYLPNSGGASKLSLRLGYQTSMVYFTLPQAYDMSINCVITLEDGHVTVHTANYTETKYFDTACNIDDTWYVAARDGNGNESSSIVCKGVTLIPDRVITRAEALQHINNPEKTLYWEGDTLKSDILDQTTIDSLQAGNGFWYPMTENISAGGYYRNHALPVPSNGITDVTAPSYKDSSWTNNGDGSYTSGGGNWEFLKFTIPDTGTGNYIIEVECYDYVSGSVRIVFTDGSQASALSVVKASGLYRFNVQTFNNLTLTIVAQNPSLIGSIRNIKVYPLSGSGLTPLTNWTETTVTNASPTGDGYQTAFVEQDSFGLPTALKKVNAGGITLADTTSEFAQQGLTLIDNAGTLQLTKD